VGHFRRLEFGALSSDENGSGWSLSAKGIPIRASVEGKRGA
jgi:hypothetical protein